MKKRFLIAVLFCIFLWNIYCITPLIWNAEPKIGQIKIFDRNDVLIAHLPKIDGLYIPIEESENLPSHLTEALLKAEDKRFFTHWGVDVIAKIRALKSNLSAKKIVSGGSTLTEQWIKNRYFRSGRRTVVQKAREATLALYASIFSSKEEVLRSYLNSAYFGNQLYGVRTASYVYYEKSDLNALTDQEIVTLLSLLRAPSTITTNEQYFQKEFQKVMSAVAENVEFPKMKFSKFKPVNKFPHVTTKILKDIKNNKNPSIIVKSTIDAGLQQEAKDLIKYSLQILGGHNVNNAAAYVFKPNTGEVLVWQGSRDFYDETIDGQVNVIEKKRQMGSALKPFIYLYAFLNGAHPDNLIVDLEKDFYKEGEKNEIFRPLNYSLHEGGVIPLKEALASSFNISAVRILEHLGLENTYEFLKTIELRLDFTAHHYGLSLALGSPDLTMKNVAETYGVLANGGEKIETTLIASVNGIPNLTKRSVILEKNIPTEEALYHLFSTLSSQTDRRLSFGLSSILNTSIPFAVKTGTTKNFKDNWTFGYRPDLVTAVWIGNNDSSAMVDITGITGAAPIWHRIVESAIKKNYVGNNEILPPESLQEHIKCITKSCAQKEVIFQNNDKKWLSDMVSGEFCLEDFYIQDIEIEEIQKIAKLFDFKDFSIKWCEQNEKEELLNNKPQIVKPEDNEIFYIKKNIPIELQKIIIKANEPVEWIINDKEYEKTETIFLIPKAEKYSIGIKGETEKRVIFVKYVEENY